MEVRRDEVVIFSQCCQWPDEIDGARAEESRIRALDRKDAETVPIIAMTANAFTEDRQKAYESGMNEHLAKPIDKEELLRTIAKYRRPERNETES